jgi:hypothetical protein
MIILTLLGQLCCFWLSSTEHVTHGIRTNLTLVVTPNPATCTVRVYALLAIYIRDKNQWPVSTGILILPGACS